MKLKAAFHRAIQAIRANILPGLLLQSLMIVFLALYVTHDGTRQFLAQIESIKQEAGFFFTFASYAISAAILPELLAIGFFQQCRITRRNIRNMLTGIPAWGLIGIMVDLFYRGQMLWLGAGQNWQTVISKMLVDQFLFSPLICTPITVAYFLWRDWGFRKSAFSQIFSLSFFPERVIPVQAAGWVIWIPGVCLVYFMPSGLQIPIAVLIQTFWVLVFTMVNRPGNSRTP